MTADRYRSESIDEALRAPVMPALVAMARKMLDEFTLRAASPIGVHVCSQCGRTGPAKHEGSSYTCAECNLAAGRTA